MKVITENETSLSGKSQTQWTYFWESLPNHFQLQFLLKIPINKYIFEYNFYQTSYSWYQSSVKLAICKLGILK